MIIDVEYDGKDIPVSVEKESALNILKHIHHCQSELYSINKEREIMNRLIKEYNNIHSLGDVFSQRLDTLHEKKEKFLLSLYWLLYALGVAQDFNLKELYEKYPDKLLTMLDTNLLVDVMGEQTVAYFVDRLVTAFLKELRKQNTDSKTDAAL